MSGTPVGFSVLAAAALMLSIGTPAHGDDAMVSGVMRSRLACRELGETLKATMQDAVQRHSFTGALAVCREAAPAIAAEISKKHGVTIRRTSLKVRNPENRPDAWEISGLTELEANIAAGADPSLTEVVDEVISENGEKEFRYLKAIIAEPLCVSCHGETLDETIRNELSALYPEDKAVGYKPGDVRGAFSVTIP